ncbi:MAG TPA: 3-deoxy-8-phosphooctulonate synthase, partial [Stellaceae bacterium]|nr:3-deoxy-8-phosphooctulonate synthase [Stellaceae bacterium]
MQPRHITIGDLTIGNDLPMVFILGPNVMESRAHALEMSTALKEIAAKLGIAFIYKTSFD